MTGTDILLITVNVLIVLGVAYVFLRGGPKDKDSTSSLEDVISRHH